jgi:hypothetical protein
VQHFRQRTRFLVFALVGLMASLGAVQFTPQAVHADDWCYGDPVVSVNGNNTQIVVGVNGSATTVAAAAVMAKIVVTVPDGVSISIVVPPPTSGAFAETLNIATSGTYSGSGPVPVKVQITFTSTAFFNTSLQVTWPTGSTTTKYGNTNGTLTTVDVQFSV